MDARVLGAIASPGIQAQVAELLRLARGALDDLAQLDEGLYERFVEQRTAPLSPEALAASLRWLWEDTFRGLVELLAFCRRLEDEQPAPSSAQTSSSADFELGDLEGGRDPAPSSDLALGAGDIGDLLDAIDEHVLGGSDERWPEVRARLSSLEYGLRSQQTDALQRRDLSLASAQANAVLALLDDTQSSASEGVHAVVAAVYEAFLPDVDLSTITPGHLTTLGRALLVRRGLAALAQAIGPHNDALQRDPSAPGDEDVDAVRRTMRTFVGSVVCRAMRPADRWQLVELEREIAEQPTKVARITCEGLVKYLDSLASVNQREVLLRHDERVLDELRESLSSARGLLEVSPRTAGELLERAGRAACELRGRGVLTDRLLDAFEGAPGPPPAPAPDDRARRLEELEAFLGAAGS